MLIVVRAMRGFALLGTPSKRNQKKVVFVVQLGRAVKWVAEAQLNQFDLTGGGSHVALRGPLRGVHS